MRQNLPVTQNEYLLRPGTTLVSTTDLRSHITYCNPAFIEVSGYAREELMGEPHNLIRHPDMPAEAFRDLWATLESGQPWAGLVKNRRKNGDHYWVRANVTPVVEDGRPVGYMSVRTVPARADVAAAEALYATMRGEARAGALVHRLRAGEVVAGTLAHRLRRGLRAVHEQRIVLGTVGMAALGWMGAQAAPLLPGGGVLAGAGVLLGATALGLAQRRSALAPLREALQLGNRMAAGDLSARPQADRAGEAGRLLRSLDQLNVNLHAVVSDLRSGVGQMSVAAREIAAGNQDLSGRTEAQAGSLQQTASSMEQITGNVRNSAGAAQQAAQLAGEASGVAERGSQAVREVVQTMADIASASRRIQDIIQVIDGISFQTNLLALNAAVEAARAGEHGRGFGVVATEVRLLSQRTQQAANEIRTLIDDAARRVEQGGRLVRDAGETMDGVTAAVQRVSRFISEVSEGAAEQLQGISQVNEAVTHIDGLTQHNAAMVEELAATAQSLHQQTAAVQDSVHIFRLREA